MSCPYVSSKASRADYSCGPVILLGSFGLARYSSSSTTPAYRYRARAVRVPS